MKWPLPHWQMAIVSLVLGLLAYFAYANQGLRHERDDLQKTNGQLSQSLRIQSDLQIRASAIDTHRTRELADAKSKIADLQRDVANGARKLRVAATCEPSATSGMADASGPRLTDTATRNYFTIRERIATSDKQIAGLQDYIRNVCLAQ